jgi:hypothetical protein
MIASSFDESNMVMDTPKGVDPDFIIPLSVCFSVSMEWNAPVTLTCWKVTKEELENIQKTGRIWIAILGHGMMPIYPTGMNPFDELKIIKPNASST